MTEKPTENRRAFPRWMIGEDASLITAAEIIPCKVEDVSAGGARLALTQDPTGEIPDEVILHVNGLPPFKVEVVRRDSPHYGVQFQDGAQYFFR
ncbi:MAG: PilZ domain-containing protein [Magnetospiraceae bacterium]